MFNYAEVILAFAVAKEIDRPFTYKIPDKLKDELKVGERVKVPFGRGNRFKIGYVIGLLEEVEYTEYKIKSILDLVDEKPILNSEQLDLIKFIVDYYATSYAAAIDAILPPGLKENALVKEPLLKKIKLSEDEEKVKAYYEINKHKKAFIKQKEILDYLMIHKEVNLKELIEKQKMSESSIKTLLQKEIICKWEVRAKEELDPILDKAFKKLNEDQKHAVDYLKTLIQSEIYKTILLQGVTGSGKTEVFLYAIREVIQKGGTAIVLVPEIALTSQTLSRFEERFGNRVALTHSRMTPIQRQHLYRKAESGELSIIIGPRSAVFMPLPNLKLIVIDEAHDSSYKSEIEPKYHAIDIAKRRMQYSKGQVLLATATPSLETYYEAKKGEIDTLKLCSRIGNAVLPDVQIVDMRLELANGNTSVISTALLQEIEETVKKGEQVMLLINRRGYATFINCRNCGYVIKCEHCDVAMTYHASTQSLQCHYCGKTKEVPIVCPECGSSRIKFFGNGTEKVEALLKQRFESYGVLRMDTDTTKGKEGHKKILEAFKRKESQILIGTQMIAKGHDFKNVTLVGILSADASLYMQDFRSNERTYQLLTQTMGRAGRGALKGKVIIQTYSPEHLVMEVVKYNRQEVFYEEELENRMLMSYPPYSHIFSLLITGKDETRVIHTAHMLAQYFRHYSEKGTSHFRVIGPSSAVITKIGDEYRWRLLILGEIREKVLIYGKYCLNKFYEHEVVTDVKVQWDIDPLSMI